MKTIACSVILSVTTALAQPAPITSTGTLATARASKYVPRVADPAVQSNILAKTGGIVHSTATGPSILFLNTQTRVSSQVFQSAQSYIQRIFRLPCEVRDRPSSEPIAEAVRALATSAAVVVIGDSAGYPSLLVAPEGRWALVNVAALSGADTSPEKLSERVHKEVWRAFGYVMGTANSNMEGCVLKPVFSLDDLDALKARSLSPETFRKIAAQAQKMGINPSRISTYRKAVEEGWATAPTNDIQRSIWDEVKKAQKK